MKTVLISIQPKWCELIANGKKTIEVRKTKPNLKTPFKCYIYETKGLYKGSGGCLFQGKGKVIGEFVCDSVHHITHCGYDARNSKLYIVDENLYSKEIDNKFLRECQLSYFDIEKYSNRNDIYGWHISNLKIYHKPKELSEFYKEDFDEVYSKWEDLFAIGVPKGCSVEYPPEPKEDDYIIKRPPQSWCYVEEMVGDGND